MSSRDSYLSFSLNDERFAIDVRTIQNILEISKITRVPNCPPHIKGLINLRGTVLPLLDTKVRMNMGETVITSDSCILVTEINSGHDTLQVGALVDRVHEVIETEPEAILPPPSLGNKFRSEFITGVIKHNETFVMLLAPDVVLAVDELAASGELLAP